MDEHILGSQEPMPNIQENVRKSVKSKIHNSLGLARAAASGFGGASFKEPKEVIPKKNPNDPYQQEKIKKAEDKRKRKGLKRFLEAASIQSLSTREFYKVFKTLDINTKSLILKKSGEVILPEEFEKLADEYMNDKEE